MALCNGQRLPETAPLSCSSDDAVNNHAAARACIPPATVGQVERRRPAASGTKRKAPATVLAGVADLAEEQRTEAVLEMELAEMDGQAGTSGEGGTALRRTSRRMGGAFFEALLAAEAAGEQDDVPTQVLHQRASAALSPAGQRRQRRAPMLEQLAAVAQEAAQEETAGEEVVEGADGNGDDVRGASCQSESNWGKGGSVLFTIVTACPNTGVQPVQLSARLHGARLMCC